MLGQFIRLSLTAAFFSLAAYLYHDAKSRHDPYAACQNRPTPSEIRQCEASVDFAMSAGW
jgi:hypothetical protein